MNVATQSDGAAHSGGAPSSDRATLAVRDLKVHFDTPDGTVFAVNGVDFELDRGEFLGVVGESGSGKSVTMMSLLGLVPSPPGRIVSGSTDFGGLDLLNLDIDAMREVRGGQIGFIFQDPMTSLNPVLTVGYQIRESLRLHTDMTKPERHARALELLELVGIPDAHQRLRSYPHQLSGGMRQRVMIALALSCTPKLIIADEPTTALDVTIQAQIVDLVRSLREQLGTTLIWITHDLGVVAGLVDRVLVMYAGKVVEEGSVEDLYSNPQHPYTQGLLGSLPRLDQKGAELRSIRGQPPSLLEEPTSCSFAARCDFVHQRCLSEVPELIEVGPRHRTTCFWDAQTQAPRT